MSYADITALNSFSGNFIEDDDTLALKQVYLDSATDIIDEYIGYSAIEADYDEYLDGSGLDSLQLSARPISVLTSITIDDVTGDPLDYYSKDEFLYTLDGTTFSKGTRNIHVEYTAGYTEVPSIFSLTCLRIAALMLSESSGNIGVTSKSFADAGTRTFVNTVNYTKYLALLNKYVKAM